MSDSKPLSHLRRRAIIPGTLDDPYEEESYIIAALHQKPEGGIPAPIISLQKSDVQLLPFITALKKAGEDVSPLVVDLKKSGEDVSPIVRGLQESGEDPSSVLYALHKSGEDVSPFLGILREAGNDISILAAALQVSNIEAPALDAPNLKNVQGDVCFIFPKRWERFLFFRIREKRLKQFRESLGRYLPMITSAAQTREDIQKNVCHREVISSGIGFSQAGLKVLGIHEKLGDPHFDGGSQFYERDALGDKGTYESPFNDPANTHGIILVATKHKSTCEAQMEIVIDLFGGSIEIVKVSEGRVRERGAEHFGWKDGISQPSLEKVTRKTWPGQRRVKPGVIIIGYPGDPLYDAGKPRPDFTREGSFMVFRKLEQNVLFLEHYVENNWDQVPRDPQPGVSLTKDERRKLFGARMFGRFKSGVPLARCPYIEDKKYAGAEENNNFDYTEKPPEYGCPLAAHIRKTAPRQLQPFVTPEYLDSSVIVRAGIPYGPEITSEEREHFETLTEDEKENLKCNRGLSFICYQSSIHNGFFRQSTLFGNNDWFPLTGLLPTKIGQDPIIGGPPDVHRSTGLTDISKEGEITLQVHNPNNTTFEVTGVAKEVDTSAKAFVQKYFVTSRGGEYYFVPSISTVRAWAILEDETEDVVKAE